MDRISGWDTRLGFIFGWLIPAFIAHSRFILTSLSIVDDGFAEGVWSRLRFPCVISRA